MPATTRRMSRSSRLSVTITNDFNVHSVHTPRFCSNSNPTVDQPAPPKHYPFPTTPTESEFYFETIMCAFALYTCACQFVNIFRTVWWLPNSYTDSAVNWYLIDFYLCMFLMVFLARRLLFVFGCKLNEIARAPEDDSELDDKGFLRVMLFGFIFILMGATLSDVVHHHPTYKILCLLYPIILYFLLFGFTIRPLLESVKWCSRSRAPLHACSSNAADIRKEAENLKRNFNDRLRQILFTSVMNAYYGGLMPCIFAPPHLLYDVNWTVHHIFFVFTSSFIFSVTHIFSLRYCDILHRCALHLGNWVRLDFDHSSILVSNEWRDDYLWPAGILVKYDDGIWKSVGYCNSCRPGDRSMTKFYKLFIFPSNPISLLLGLHILVIIYQKYLIVNTFAWHQILSLSFILFFNYYALYKMARDYLVSDKIYKLERDMHEKTDYK